jgi:hypothetical protein
MLTKTPATYQTIVIIEFFQQSGYRILLTSVD